MDQESQTDSKERITMASQPRSTFRRLLFPASGLIALCAFVHACGGGGGSSGGGSPPPAPNPNPGPTTFVVTSMFPANSATGVSRLPIVLIDFNVNHTVNPATMTGATVQLLQGAVQITSTLTYLSCSNQVQLTPNVALDPGVLYTVNLTAGLQDTNGEGLVAVTFSFTTTASADVARPSEPGGVTAMPNPGTGTTDVLLSWTDATDNLSGPTAIFYRVYRTTEDAACFD